MSACDVDLRRAVAEGLNRCINTGGSVTPAMQRFYCHPSRVSGRRAALKDIETTGAPRFAPEAPKRCRCEYELDMQFNMYAEQAQKIMADATASLLPPSAPAPTSRLPLPDPDHTHHSAVPQYPRGPPYQPPSMGFHQMLAQMDRYHR